MQLFTNESTCHWVRHWWGGGHQTRRQHFFICLLYAIPAPDGLARLPLAVHPTHPAMLRLLRLLLQLRLKPFMLQLPPYHPPVAMWVVAPIRGRRSGNQLLGLVYYERHMLAPESLCR